MIKNTEDLNENKMGGCMFSIPFCTYKYQRDGFLIENGVVF